MPEKREPEFTITDRRRFTSEGEATQPPTEAEQPESETPNARAAEPASTVPRSSVGGDVEHLDQREYPAPTAEERKAQEEAFQASSRKLDAELQSALGGRSAQDLQMSFERFIASLYMSALLQLGLMREQGAPPPPVDLVGARQTVDTLAILADKTKGNLTAQEDDLLQNCLYELRMAYVEVTNALTRAPQPGTGGPPRAK